MANVPVQLKRIDTQLEAVSSNTVLLDGQCIRVKDSGRIYWGDGTSTLAQLMASDYTPPISEVSALAQAAADQAETDANAYTDTAAANAEANANAYADTAIANHVGDSDPHGDRAYADGLVVGLFDDRGNWDASGNVWPSSGGSGTAGAILKGDVWRVSAAGTLGGEVADVGDSFRALADSPGQTASNWALFAANTQQATESIRGTAPIATQAEAEDQASTNDTDIVTPKKWWQAFASAFTAVGRALSSLANPSAISFIRINADNSVTARSAANYRSDLGLGTAAQANTGTGASDVPTITQADARYKLASNEVVAVLDQDYVNNNAAYANVLTNGGAGPALTITLDANSVYELTGRVVSTTPSASTGVGYALTMTGSPTTRNVVREYLVATAQANALSQALNVDDTYTTVTSYTASTKLPTMFDGLIVTSGSACTITLRVIRGGTSNNVTTCAGSFLKAIKLA